MQPLAYKMRPKNIDEVIGHEKVKGIIKKMIENNKLQSMIIYGPPGVGKTTIANIICQNYSNDYIFNASTDNKAKLKEMIEGNNLFKSPVILIDEIHRLKKDIQDYLLPFIESGETKIIGLTTENPYHVINKAIRSRVLIFELKPLALDDIKILINRALNEYLNNITIDDDCYEYIFKASNGEPRFALNILENASLFDNHITIENMKEVIGNENFSLDKDSEDYYKILSGLHKSIRGSDVNAALHYAARLIKMGDYESLFRRLIAIAYEDVGLANPQIGPRVIAAYEAFRIVGYPEGLQPLAVIICDLALSPKSNSAYEALSKAIEAYENNNCGNIPDHLNNDLIGAKKAIYKYPHDYPGGWVLQQYLPDPIKDHRYYEPKETSSYERALKERYDIINKKQK